MATPNSNSKKLLTRPETELTPEEETLVMRLSIFIKMRWVAILGVIAVTLVARYAFNIGFPTLPVYVVCVFMALYNLLLTRQLSGLNKLPAEQIIPHARRIGYFHIILDMVALAVLLHFTGGMENPFVYLFVFHIVLASIGLNYRAVYLLCTVALVMVSSLYGLEAAGIIPHVNLEGFVLPTRYQQTGRIAAQLLVLAVLLYGTAYMSTAIVREMRRRQREVALRGKLLAEKIDELEGAFGEIGELKEERDKFLYFIGVAAHDLKAPLTAIQGFLWVMLGGFTGEISEKQRNILERSAHRITELLRLISDLLDIPRIESGQIVQEMKEVSLHQVIFHSIEVQRNLAEAKGIELKVEISEELPRIMGSAPRLEQVITNLVNNAIKYTPHGTVTVRANERDTDVLVEVIDTGIGIPPEDISRLFEDFFRASNAVSKGTGLGLSISRRIVEAHGGRIWAESPCSGTTSGTKLSFMLPKMSKTTKS
jgi:signal transduction histidine kinase